MGYMAKKLTSKSYLATAGIAVILLSSGIFLLVRHNSKQNRSIIPSIPTTTKTQAPSPDKQAESSGNTADVSNNYSADKSTVSPPSASAPIIAPSGTFVSNHSPGQNGSSTSEQSVCNTTPGATCNIQFTKDGVTKKLEAQVADTNGVAYWTWDVKDAGFSAGSWKVSAVAMLNGQTKTADDVIPLEVQP